MKKPNLYLSSQVYPNILDDREFVPSASTPSESSDAKRQRLLVEYAEVSAKAEWRKFVPIAAGFLVGSSTEGDTSTKLVAGLAAMLAANLMQNYLEARASDTSPFKIGDRISEGSAETARLFAEIEGRTRQELANMELQRRAAEQAEQYRQAVASAMQRHRQTMLKWESGQRPQQYGPPSPAPQARAAVKTMQELVAHQKAGGKSTITGTGTRKV